MSDGKLRPGQLYDPSDDVVTGYVEQMRDEEGMNDLLGDARSEITPVDAQAWNTKIFDVNTSAYDSLVRQYPAIVNFELPTELTNIAIYFNATKGDGSDNHVATGYSIGDTYSMSISIPSSAHGSISVIAEAIVTRQSPNARNVNVIEVFFYQRGNFTFSDIYTRLTQIFGVTVSRWPRFQPREVQINLRGNDITLSASAAVQQSVSHSSANTSFTNSKGGGTSVNLGNTTRTITIPDSIHPPLTIRNSIYRGSVSVNAGAGWAAGDNFPALAAGYGFNNYPARNAVLAEVFPTSIAGTTIYTIPRTGHTLLDFKTAQGKYDYTKCYAQVLNWTSVWR